MYLNQGGLACTIVCYTMYVFHACRGGTLYSRKCDKPGLAVCSIERFLYTNRPDRLLNKKISFTQTGLAVCSIGRFLYTNRPGRLLNRKIFFTQTLHNCCSKNSLERTC